jgi:uncharacterized membrane protein
LKLITSIDLKEVSSFKNYKMKNRNVGFLVIGIAVVIGVIILIFNYGLKDMLSQSCGHGTSCTMYDSIATQTQMSLAIAGLVLIIGIFLVFSKEEKEIIIKKIKEKAKKKKLDLVGLNPVEREAIKILQHEKGAIFQRTLMEKLEVGKIKMTRLLDKLETRQLVERKRRGMNNIVVLLDKESD